MSELFEQVAKYKQEHSATRETLQIWDEVAPIYAGAMQAMLAFFAFRQAMTTLITSAGETEANIQQVSDAMLKLAEEDAK